MSEQEVHEHNLDKIHYADHKIMYKAITDKALTSIRQGFMLALPILLGVIGYLWNKNTELEHRLTTLEVGHEKVEKVMNDHIDDPKLHHNIKEQLSTLEKEMAVISDRVAEIGDDLDDHESHPKLHENIVTTVKVLEERIDAIKRKL